MAESIELAEAFKLLDSDNDGVISPKEAREFFRDSDTRTKNELEAVIKNCDKGQRDIQMLLRARLHYVTKPCYVGHMAV